nr:MAG TPA: NinB protein [Caudoviricetes sp.]
MKIEFKKADLVPTMAKVGAFIESLVDKEEYVLEIKPRVKHRSLDANRYMWVLISKLQAELAKNDPQITKDEIYQGYVRQYGKSVDYQLPDSAVNAMTKSWGRNGLGWTAEKVDDGIYPRTSLVRFYYGTSCYGSKRMARLIDAVVQDCKALHIETMPPAELAQLMSAWEERKQ